MKRRNRRVSAKARGGFPPRAGEDLENAQRQPAAKLAPSSRAAAFCFELSRLRARIASGVWAEVPTIIPAATRRSRQPETIRSICASAPCPADFGARQFDRSLGHRQSGFTRLAAQRRKANLGGAERGVIAIGIDPVLRPRARRVERADFARGSVDPTVETLQAGVGGEIVMADIDADLFGVSARGAGERQGGNRRGQRNGHFHGVVSSCRVGGAAVDAQHDGCA